MAEYVNENAPQYSEQRKAKGGPMMRNFGIGGTSPVPIVGMGGGPKGGGSMGGGTFTGNTRILDPDEHKEVTPPGKSLGKVLKGLADVAVAAGTGGINAIYGTGVVRPGTGGKVEKDDDKETEEEKKIRLEKEAKEGKSGEELVDEQIGDKPPTGGAAAAAAATGAKYRAPLKKRGAAGTGGYSRASGMGSSTRLKPSERLTFPSPGGSIYGGGKSGDKGTGTGAGSIPGVNINIHDLVKQNIAGMGGASPQITQQYTSKQTPKKERSAAGKDFDKAFAKARKSGATTFQWTHPKTGKIGTYTAELAKPSTTIKDYTKNVKKQGPDDSSRGNIYQVIN